MQKKKHLFLGLLLIVLLVASACGFTAAEASEHEQMDALWRQP